MLISGRNVVNEYLKTGKRIHKAYILKSSQKATLINIENKLKKNNIDIKYCDRRELDHRSEYGNHQGIIIQIDDFKYSSIDEVLNDARLKNEDPFLLILDEIEDPHNLGAMVRSAEAAGCHGVVVQKRRSCPVNEAVFKASSGAINYIPICQVTNISQFIKRIKKENIFVYGTSGYAKNYHTETNLTGPIAIVIGNEGKGMRRLVSENCDDMIKIPIIGQIESLNASTACAVVLYEIVRQRNAKA